MRNAHDVDIFNERDRPILDMVLRDNGIWHIANEHNNGKSRYGMFATTRIQTD